MDKFKKANELIDAFFLLSHNLSQLEDRIMKTREDIIRIEKEWDELCGGDPYMKSLLAVEGMQ